MLRVLYAVSGLFLHCAEVYSGKRSIVYKDADVDLIIFIKLTIKVFSSCPIGFQQVAGRAVRRDG